MSSQPTSETWDGGVELRTYIDMFARHKWLILGLIVAALAVAAVLSYVVLPPSYESSAVVTLPVADGTNGLGTSPRGYEELAGSAPVMDNLKQKLGLGISSFDLRGRFQISLEPNTRLLNVKASAGTAGEANQLALGWADAYGEQTLTLIEGQLAEQKAASQKAVGKLLGSLTKAEDDLAAFDRQNPISLMAARLSSMEGELVNSEATLRALTTTSIPTDEARAAFLESALNKEPRTLNGTVGNVGLPKDSGGAGVTSNDVTLLNPVYLQLSQDLTATRTRLAANAREVQALREHIPPLQSDIDQLGTKIILARAERERLYRQVQEATVVYQQAKTGLDTLLATESRIVALARPGVLREPVLPQSPVAPRKALNMAMGGLAGALLGLALSLVLEWNRSTAPVLAAPGRRAAPVASPGENAS